MAQEAKGRKQGIVFLIKIKSFCVSKDTLKKVMRIHRRKYLQIITSKNLVFKIYN